MFIRTWKIRFKEVLIGVRIAGVNNINLKDILSNKQKR